MDADTPTPSINLAQHELDKSKAMWAAEKVRRVAENDALNWIQPNHLEKADVDLQTVGRQDGRRARRAAAEFYPKA